jgi:hypothetical protein
MSIYHGILRVRKVNDTERYVTFSYKISSGSSPLKYAYNSIPVLCIETLSRASQRFLNLFSMIISPRAARFAWLIWKTIERACGLMMNNQVVLRIRHCWSLENAEMGEASNKGRILRVKLADHLNVRLARQPTSR